MSVIVRGYRDRIQRGSGSVVVSAAGAVTHDTASGTTGYLRAGGAAIATWSATTGLSASGAMAVGGTLTVSGTGTHSFAGPVKVSSTVGGTMFEADNTSVNSGYMRWRRSGAQRLLLGLESNNDGILFAVTGATGSETFTEALRIVNANAYVSVATRLGVGTASPAYQAHVVGNGYVTGVIGVGAVPDTTKAQLIASTAATDRPGALIQQTAASATAPVLVVKGGATPGTGGDLQQWQNSAGSAVMRVDATGTVRANAFTITSTSGSFEFPDRSTTPPVGNSGTARLWYDDTAKAFKYIDSAGTVRTITAA